MTQMTAVFQQRYGDPDRLAVATIRRPQPGPSEVVVEVKAAGLSPGDRAMVTGVPYVNRLAASGLARPGNPVPGFDCAGIVSAVGSEVEGLAIGDRVFGNAPGSLAEFAIAQPHQLAAIPTGWSFVEAATVPESGCVALQAVRDKGGVEAGQRVAIVGAGGGVGCHALQIARSRGAHVTAVCGTRMLEQVRSLGADDVVDYHTTALADTGRRYDVIIDAAGTTALHQLRDALTDHGRLVLVGSDHRHRWTGGLGRWARALLWSPFVPQGLQPFVARPLGDDDLAELVELMEAGDLEACVDRTFPLAETAEAMRYLDHRTSPGKVVVVP